MVAGISTACFYPEQTEWALRYLADAGVSHTEIFFNAPSELRPPLLTEMRQIAQNSGIKILSIHPFTSGIEPLFFFSNYRRRFEDGIEVYKRFFEAANLLGAEILVFHGDRREASKPRSRYFDLFGELCEAGLRMGVTVAQENVPRCASYCPDFFREMAAYLPQARFVLDIKQAVRAGYSVKEMLDAMGNRLIHLHLSDHRPGADCLPLGAGELDLAWLVRQLRSVEYTGGLLLELYRDNYDVYEELLESYQRLKQAIDGKQV